jgi:hypothetical protein
MQETSDSPFSFTESVPKISADSKLRPRHYWLLLRFAAVIAAVLLAPFLRYNRWLATKADEQAAVQLETVIHQQMASGAIDKMYIDSDIPFQKAVTLAHHQAYLAAIAQRYGRPLDCAPTDTAVKFGFGTKSIWSKCVTNFSGGKSVVESFMWTTGEGGYKLHSYAILKVN